MMLNQCTKDFQSLIERLQLLRAYEDADENSRCISHSAHFTSSVVVIATGLVCGSLLSDTDCRLLCCKLVAMLRQSVSK